MLLVVQLPSLAFLVASFLQHPEVLVASSFLEHLEVLVGSFPEHQEDLEASSFLEHLELLVVEA